MPVNSITYRSRKWPDARCYRIHRKWSDGPDSRRHGFWFAENCATYATLGDGMVQHEPESIVAGQAQIADMLHSLLDYFTECLQVDDDRYNEALDLLSEFWPREERGLETDHYRWLASIKWNEDPKRNSQFVNLKEMKKSYNYDKRHDKRWRQLTSWDDGSFQCTFTYAQETIGTPTNILWQMWLCNQLVKAVDSISVYDMWHWMCPDSDYNEFSEMNRNFRTVQYAVIAYRESNWMKQAIKGRTGNTVICVPQ